MCFLKVPERLLLFFPFATKLKHFLDEKGIFIFLLFPFLIFLTVIRNRVF